MTDGIRFAIEESISENRTIDIAAKDASKMSDYILAEWDHDGDGDAVEIDGIWDVWGTANGQKWRLRLTEAVRS